MAEPLGDALDRHGALLDQVTGGLADPAEVFALSLRLTGRLHRRNPALSKVLLSAGVPQARADSALTPQARRDIDAAVRAARCRSRPRRPGPGPRPVGGSRTAEATIV